MKKNVLMDRKIKEALSNILWMAWMNTRRFIFAIWLINEISALTIYTPYGFKGSEFKVDLNQWFLNLLYETALLKFLSRSVWTPRSEAALIWNSVWLELWTDWTSNIERPTSNVQYWWRYALSIFKQANHAEVVIYRPQNTDPNNFEGQLRFAQSFFKSTEYIIRCWMFDVRCSMFIC